MAYPCRNAITLMCAQLSGSDLGRPGSRLLPIFTLLLGAALAARLWVLQDIAEQALGCRLCVVPGVLRADLLLLAVLGAMFALSTVVVGRLAGLAWRVLPMLGLLIYVADVVVMSQFVTRLMLADARIYLAQPGVVWRHLATFSWWQLSLAGAVAVALAMLCLPRPSRPRPMRKLAVLVVPLVAVGFSARFVLPVPSYVHEWALRNVFEINLDSGVAHDYGADTRQRLAGQGSGAEIPHCVAGRAQRAPVVVLVLESWSAYHSALWAGMNDWTPRLDAIAREARYFRRLHAGGFNTNEGLISLLGGRDFVLPIKPPHRFEAFEGAWGLEESLPRSMAAEGFHTAFLTSGNLAFTRKGEWLAEIGFDHVEGHDQADYEGIARHHFDSVPDDILYRRALKYIAEQELADRPAFVVIESVSTHHPFAHPYTGEHSEEAVFRFMDDTAADFIGALRQSGFLERGLLVVVSDHRAMTMSSAAEQKRLGRAAASLIPAFAIGRGITPGGLDARLHQADLMPTLMRHASQTYCYTGPLRDFLDPAGPEPRCVIHARGDARERLDVFCESGEGTVRVAGDESRFAQAEGLSAETQARLLERIARERLTAQARSTP